MRGEETGQGAAFSYVSTEERIPADHPLRTIRRMTDEVLERMADAFAELYSWTGRPSVPPERLLRALLLQALYTIRSERLLMEQLHYNLLFRWFVGMDLDEKVWTPTVFTKNRDRLLEGDIAARFFAEVVDLARAKRLLSDEHFTVDGTMIEAWAGHKSFRRRDDKRPKGPQGGFRGEKRSNETHESTTDPEARLYRRTHHGEAKLCYLGHIVTENRNGLAVAGCLTKADGFAERSAALDLVEPLRQSKRITLGADKGYDAAAFVASLRQLGVTPHIAQNNTRRRSAIDGRTTRHRGYRMSQALRPMIERVPGWLKNVAGLRKTKHRGEKRVGWTFLFALGVYNLVRMKTIEVVT
jgi:transposase